MQFSHNQRFWTVFTFFTMLTWIFLKITKSLEHLKVLLCIFFVSGVFQNFDVDFWPLLKAKKVLALKQFCRKKNVSSKFYFLSSIRIYKLSASRITENSSHCYTLTFRVKSVPFQKWNIVFRKNALRFSERWSFLLIQTRLIII